MKIKPVILCGGSGTRLWPNLKKNYPKQFIDFGGWTLFEETLSRIKSPAFDYPIISTNLIYLKLVKKYLLKNKFKKFKIILEPFKKNTAPAILSSALINEVHKNQPIIFLPSDHLIENKRRFINSMVSNKKNLNDINIFIFGIKPKVASSQYGYFVSKKVAKKLNKVIKFIEKPKLNRVKKIIKKNGYLNSGILFAKKSSIINNFERYNKKMLLLATESIKKGKHYNNVFYLNKKIFNLSVR